MCVYQYVCIVLLCAGANKGQKALDSLELELQVVLSLLIWVLGTELYSYKSSKCF